MNNPLRGAITLGRVVKGVAGQYLVVDNQGNRYNCSARKTIKGNLGNILIGDIADFSNASDSFVIENIEKRKNSLKRPPVSNIDMALLLISETPIPDFYLIDKMLVTLSILNIPSYVVVTKADLGMESLYEKTRDNYINHVEDVLLISSYNDKDVLAIKELLKGKLTCLIGQSAVGKSSLINALQPSAKFEVGDLSKKINRGKQTTRHSEIVEIQPGSYLIDTPGFSFFDLEIDPEDLKKHYFDFNNVSDKCVFRNCNHLNEPNCAVKEAVLKGDISKERYDRYVELYNELMTKWRNKYG